MKYGVLSTLKKGTNDYQAFEELLKKSQGDCHILSTGDAKDEVEKVDFMLKSSTFHVPAGIELTEQEKQAIDTAVKLQKSVRFFSHGELPDNQDTLSYMRELRVAENSYKGTDDIFFPVEEDNSYSDDDLPNL